MSFTGRRALFCFPKLSVIMVPNRRSCPFGRRSRGTARTRNTPRFAVPWALWSRPRRRQKDELADAVLNLGKDIGIERIFSSIIFEEKLDENKLEVLGYLAYEDPCTPAFLREPLVADMVLVLRDAYKGN